MAKKQKYYKSIEDITVYIFYKIIQTKKVNFLLKGYDENDEIEKELTARFKIIFTEILERYNAINSTPKTIKSMKAKARIDIMESEYNIILSVLKLYEKTNSIDFLFLLNDVGGNFKFNSENKVEPQVRKALSSLKALKMKIKIEKIKYSKLHELKLEDTKVDYLSDLEKQAINIERALDLKYQIDTKNTTLIRWCNLIKLTQDKIENNG